MALDGPLLLRPRKQKSDRFTYMISKYKDYIAIKDNNTKTMILNDFLIKSLDIAIKDFNKVIFVIDFIKNFIEMYRLF